VRRGLAGRGSVVEQPGAAGTSLTARSAARQSPHFPGEEDVGIVGVESLTTVRLVVALGWGGIPDVLGSTCGPLLGGPPRQEPGGVVFAEQAPSSPANAIRTLEELGSPDFAAHQSLAQRFTVARFRQCILAMARRLSDST